MYIHIILLSHYLLYNINKFSVVSQDYVKYFSKLILNIIHNDKKIENIIKINL